MPADIAPVDVSQTKQTPDSAEPVVVFEDVSITFDIKPVLQNISFTVYCGETRIILGPAGGGKSVLMKLANGLIRPDSGTIRVFGEDVTRMPRPTSSNFVRASAWSFRSPHSLIPSQ